MMIRPPLKMLPEEGRERCRVIWEAGWAKRRRDMSIWEGRCRTALLGIYWERAEELDRWAVATVQWRFMRELQLRYQLLWDQGLVRHRAQEEGAKMWQGEGAQIWSSITWHVMTGS